MKKNLIIQKKHHFSFINGSAFLVFNMSISNLFITLMDENKNVIISKTSGSAKVGIQKEKSYLYKLLIIF